MKSYSQLPLVWLSPFKQDELNTYQIDKINTFGALANIKQNNSCILEN